MKSASFRPHTQWVLPARLLSLHFLSETMPLNSRCQTCLDRALAFLPAATCPKASQRAHTLSTHMCTHRHAHTHTYILLHIFAGVHRSHTHNGHTICANDRSQFCFLPTQAPESSNPQGLTPQAHSEPALDARSLYPNPSTSASATYKPIELAPWEG